MEAVPIDSRAVLHFERISRIFQAGAGLLAVLILLGYLLRRPELTGVVPGFVSVKANSALCILGLSMLLRAAAPQRPAVVAIGLLALLTLSQDLLGWETGLDQAFIFDPHSSGHMSPFTALSVLLLALGIALPAQRFPHPREVCAITVLLSAASILVGYLFRAQEFYRFGSLPLVPLGTGLCLTSLSLALLFSRPEQGFMRLLVSQTTSAQGSRRLLPLLVLVPVLLGLLCALGQHQGLLDGAHAGALCALANVTCLTGLTLGGLERGIQAEQANLRMTRHLAELEARAGTDRRLRSFSDSLREGLVTLNARGQVLDWSKGAERLFGLAHDQAIGRSYESLLLNPADCPPWSGQTAGTTREHWMRNCSGGSFPGEVSFSCWSGPEGEVYSALVRDVSDRHEREETVYRYHQIIEALGDGLGWTDSAGSLLFLNAAGRRLFSLGATQALTGLKLSDYLDLCAEDLTSMRQGEVVHRAADLRRADGSRLSVWQTLVAIVPRGSEAISVACVIRDRSQELATQSDLSHALEQARSADFAKTEFLATVSHELRTPLNSILGFGQMLKTEKFGPLTPRQSRYVDNILQSGQHLLELVVAILDHSQAEAGKLQMRPGPLQLRPVLEECQNLFQDSAQAKGLEFRVRWEESLPAIWGDPLRIRQILINLVSNAIKFTAKGQVEVEATSTPKEVVLRVIDSGIGIAEKDQLRVFEKFEQAQGSYARAYQGTGLGLTLVRDLVHQHGGKITLESSPGEGCRFTIQLPRLQEANSPTRMLRNEVDSGH